MYIHKVEQLTLLEPFTIFLTLIYIPFLNQVYTGINYYLDRT